MSDGGHCFQPLEPLIPGRAEPGCRACVTIPARNEAATLGRCLDALGRQVDLQGNPLLPACFEVLLLLNNCTDTSADAAREWQSRHAAAGWLRVIERHLPREQAHVGTARRMLMDTAWFRLQGGHDASAAAILSTDADTVVAPDWLVQNLQALRRGADVVGGAVDVAAAELAELPPAVQRRYRRDRVYADRIAQLEDLLDPQDGDPWPRHLDHFGSSLACTPEAYARAGGMPAVSPLEDEAFIDRARRAGLRLRHEPAVRVCTSARLQGRAAVGLAGQFRQWNEMRDDGSHQVQSAAFLEHRFVWLRRLWRVFATQDLGGLPLQTEWWRRTFEDALATEESCGGFLGAVYCDTLIQESFSGKRVEPVQDALEALSARIATLRAALV